MPLPFMPAQSSRRARGAPTARFAVRLRVALRFAQQPTGLTLPFGALMVSLPSQISAFCALAARSPCICPFANIGVLCATAHSPCICSRLRVALRYAQQPAGLTLPSGAPSGRFGPSAQVSRLLNHSRFPNGRAHGFAAPLRVALGLRPKCPPGTRFPSRHWAHASFRRTFGSLCRLWRQQPTGLTLPSGAGRAGSLRPWAQTFLKLLAEKAAADGLFRQAEARGSAPRLLPAMRSGRDAHTQHRQPSRI